jgi:nucleotide-binding universal stress UspA family protein
MKKLSIQNILVPIDFSKMSTQAIETAKRLAERFGATVHLAHVHEFEYPAGFIGPVFSAGGLPESFEEHRRKALVEDLSELARSRGLSPAGATHLREGAPAFDEICSLARELPADLIVMPTHGRTGLKHVFLGSTAERIVQHSPCPVFVTRQKKRKSKTGSAFAINTILVPVDFSGCSLEGLRYAIGFANEFGAKIILLHATYLGYIYSSEGTAIYDVGALREAARNKAERQMRELVRAVKFARVKFETVLTSGSPVLDICVFAQDHDVDLIITSTHGQTGWKHMLMGSTAEHVARYAPCPVLVVPSHPKIRAAKSMRPAERGHKTKRPVANKKASRTLIERDKLTRKYRKLASHPFPERRKTNKFREARSRTGI